MEKVRINTVNGVIDTSLLRRVKVWAALITLTKGDYGYEGTFQSDLTS